MVLVAAVVSGPLYPCLTWANGTLMARLETLINRVQALTIFGARSPVHQWVHKCGIRTRRVGRGGSLRQRSSSYRPMESGKIRTIRLQTVGQLVANEREGGRAARGDDSSNVTILAAKISIVTFVITLLAWFGVKSWHDFATKILHADGGASSAQSPNTSQSLPSLPLVTSLFPLSFPHNGSTYTATRRPDSWAAYGCLGVEGVVPASVAGTSAEYRADDNSSVNLHVTICLYENEGQAGTKRRSDDQVHSKVPHYVGTQGRYEIAVIFGTPWDPSEEGSRQGALFTLAVQVLKALPGG